MNKSDFDLSRRSLLSAAGSAAVAGLLPGLAAAAAPPPIPFNRVTVLERAREIAKARYKPPPSELPGALANLTYDQYRDIRIRPDVFPWPQNLPFRLQLFHRGLYSKPRVDVSIADGDGARQLAYSADMFSFGESVPGPPPSGDIGFGGIRLLGPINRPDRFDEIAVFQGASYFRAVGRNQIYGVSARGLALKTADKDGEEFPIFRQFWIEQPSEKATTIVVHALLDGPSVAGAYRFSIRPGLPTVMDVEATLIPRVDLTKVGLAPQTSMFYFGANGRRNVDDYRPEVHDSDGLLIYNGGGEQLWRPLSNPKSLQISAFIDHSPRGFGLMQRNRSFANYQDIEGRYDKRPSLWVEPIGDWGPGAVTLVEIPSDSEINDNIVAFWQPSTPIAAKSEFTLSYRLAFGERPSPQDGAIFVESTRRGAGVLERPTQLRLFVIDFGIGGDKQPELPLPKPNVWASAGQISSVVIDERPDAPGWRVAFRLDPQGANLVELRASLAFATPRPAETWVYRWTGE